MILDKEIKLLINPKLDRTYYKLGYYDRNIISDPIELLIKIEDLNKTLRIKVNVKCDICSEEKYIKYYKYIYNISNCNFYACSPKCASIKNKFTCKEKYGNENYNNREKSKSTCIDKYGVDNVQKNKEISKKTVETYKKNDGYSKMFEKVRKKIYEKHGKFHALQVKELLDKANNTRFEKYGDENYNNREKSKLTCIKKYGVDNVQKSSYLKNKKKKDIIILHPDILSISEDFIYSLKCDLEKNHIFEILPEQYYQRKLSKTIICTVCNEIGSTKSGQENLVYNFIKSNYDGILLRNKRNIISPKELDIYLPDLKLAFEYNGLYHHNELVVGNEYHFNKTERCEEKNIQLIHIYEDDWIYKQDIIKSRILNLLGKTTNKIYGRKSVIKEVENYLVKSFLEKNHLQGFVGSSIKIGLFYNDELVSLMTFGKQRKSMGSKSSENVYEMLRFCNKLNTSVIGGADKLFKHFIKNYKPLEIISYADRSWSQGDLYKKLGFTFISKTQPNYYYIIGDMRKYRFNFRKDLLVKQGFDSNKTEHDIMLERNIFRIYDSGSLKFCFNS